MNFKETKQFERDLKKLGRRYKSLLEDLKNFKQLISKKPFGAGNRSTILCKKGKVSIIKARLYCLYLKKSSLRIIYAYHEKTDEIELISFIELYSKSDKEREDLSRIQEYIKFGS